MLMYADDTVIYYSHKDIDRIRENLQCDFNRFLTWLEKNELVINTKIGKTETMIFGTGRRISMTENVSLNVKYRENTINQTDNYKYLGLCLNNTLCMTQHIKSSIKKASSRLNLLRKMRYFMDSKTAALIYQSMTLPFLTSCTFATYGATPKYLKDTISMLERRASGIIKGGYEAPDTNRIKFKRVCSYVHLCLYGEVCKPFEGYFELKEQKRDTRNFSAVTIPRFKLESARYSFLVQGAAAFNKLPKELQLEKNHLKFKLLLKDV